MTILSKILMIELKLERNKKRNIPARAGSITLGFLREVRVPMIDLDSVNSGKTHA